MNEDKIPDAVADETVPDSDAADETRPAVTFLMHMKHSFWD